MKKLKIPQPLKSEFATVEALWVSNGTTRRVDAFLLCWVKYEKQLRKLFAFLVFQHPKVTDKTIESIVSVMVENKKLNPESLERGINALGVSNVPQLIGEKHKALSIELARIRKYRNKLMHGQITGQKISSYQIEKDVVLLISWISELGIRAKQEFGYDGIQRNTFREAKAVSSIVVSEFPFTNAFEFKAWLKKVCNA